MECNSLTGKNCLYASRSRRYGEDKEYSVCSSLMSDPIGDILYKCVDDDSAGDIRAHNSLPPFSDDHKTFLSVVSLTSQRCAQHRSVEKILSALLSTQLQTPEVTLTLSQDGPINSSVRPMTPTNERSTYIEIQILYHIHGLRCVLRDMQQAGRQMNCEDISSILSSIQSLYSVLPDPLLLAIHHIVSSLQQSLKSTDDKAFQEKQLNLLLTNVLSLCEHIQFQLLTESKQLTRRAGAITIVARHIIPFVA